MVQGLPASLKLSFWAQFISEEAGVIPIEFKVIGPHDAIYAQGFGSFDVKAAKEASAIAIIGVNCLIQNEGELKLMMRKAGVGEFEIIRKIPIRTGPIPGIKTAQTK